MRWDKQQRKWHVALHDYLPGSAAFWGAVTASFHTAVHHRADLRVNIR
ncbi:MAG: hypothetical protein HOH17_05855 [Halieaceae bacterium]|nr:hypothetical protein [Halieaceae bacterium]